MLRNKSWMIVAWLRCWESAARMRRSRSASPTSASGPGAVLGQPQSKTVAALPKEIAGQKITYFPLDDELDPTKGAQNARKLIAEQKVDV